MVGARGFVADFALIVTWARMGYGGVPRYLELDRHAEVLKWVSYSTRQTVIIQTRSIADDSSKTRTKSSWPPTRSGLSSYSTMAISTGPPLLLLEHPVDEVVDNQPWYA